MRSPSECVLSQCGLLTGADKNHQHARYRTPAHILPEVYSPARKTVQPLGMWGLGSCCPAQPTSNRPSPLLIDQATPRRLYSIRSQLQSSLVGSECSVCHCYRVQATVSVVELRSSCQPRSSRIGLAYRRFGMAQKHQFRLGKNAAPSP
jgi:hypothetical protein